MYHTFIRERCIVALPRFGQPHDSGKNGIYILSTIKKQLKDHKTLNSLRVAHKESTREDFSQAIAVAVAIPFKLRLAASHLYTQASLSKPLSEHNSKS